MRKYLLLALLAFAALPSHALGEIRLVSPSDTLGVNYYDATVNLNETAVIELWVQADTNFNGFASYFIYDGNGIRLRETADATDSFPVGTVGIQSNEDRVSFGDILRNHGSATGASTDTFSYAALSNADSVTGSFRAATLSFLADTVGIWTVRFVFDSAANKVTAVASANGNGSDIMTANDSGVIRVIIPDTPVIQTLSFVSDTPSRFFDGAPFDTTAAGDTVWFASETQTVTMTLVMTSSNPESIHVGAIFDSTAQTDNVDSFRATFHIKPGHATLDTTTIVTAYALSGNIDTTKILFRPDTVAADTVTRLDPIGGVMNPAPTFRWTPSSDSQSGVGNYRLQVADSTTFANIVVDTTTPHPDTDLAINTLPAGTFYWRVLAYDRVGNVVATGLGSDSFRTAVDTSGPNAWYLNDTSAAGDVFTSQLGYDTASGALPSEPKRTFAAIRNLLTIGDTVYFDAGTYADTVTVDTNMIWLIGKDSASSIIVPPSGEAVFSDTQNQITVQDLRIIGGIRFINVDASLITRTQISGGSSHGISLEGGSENNRVAHNVIHSNALAGVSILSANNVVTQNDVAANTQYQIDLGVAAIVEKNNIRPSAANPDSAMRSTVTASALRNFWNTTDTALIGQRIIGTVTYTPFRLGAVDTISASSDTVAPRAPDTVAAVALDSATIRLTWGAVSANEEPSPFAVGLAEYRVYRATSATASSWTLRASVAPATQIYNDTGNGANQTWFYRVTSADSATPLENQSFFSDSISGATTLESTPPSAFTLVEPTQGHETNVTLLRFNWTVAADSNAVTYRLLVDTDMAGPPLVDTTVSDTEEFVVISANDTYLWRVIATDSAGNSRTVGDSTFIVDTAPPTGLALSAPADLHDTNVTTIVFRWTAATDALSGLKDYRFQIDTGGAPIYDTTTLALSDTRTLAANDTYFWRVIATDDAGNTIATTARRLRIDTVPPTAPVPTSPSTPHDTNATTVTFAWTNGTDALLREHRLQIDTSGLFASLIVDSTGTTHTLSANDTYFWRIVAIDSATNQTVSTTSTLRIDTGAPSPFTLIEPPQGHETNVVSLRFRWSAATDPLSVSYRLIIDTDMAGSFVGDTTVTDLEEIITLPANDTYLWRVTATDSAGNSRVVGDSSFVIDTAAPNAPVAVTPTANHETNAVVIGFDWTASTDSLAGLAAYRLQIDTGGTYSAGSITVDSDVIASDTNITLADGVYFWRVRARDEASNVTAYTTPVRFVVDRTAPVISAVTLASNVGAYFTDVGGIDTTTLRDTVYFNNSGSGAGQNVTCTIVVTNVADSVTFPQNFGDGPFGDSTVPYAFTYSIELGHGDTTSVIFARDTAANNDSITIDWVRDTVPPPVVVLIAPSDSQTVGDTTPTLSWNASVDTLSGTRGYLVQIATSNSFATVLQSNFVTTTSYTATGLADSPYYWRVIPYDTVSNADTAAAAVRAFIIDSGVPFISQITIVSSVATHIFDDTPITPSLAGDTVWFNSTGAGGNQFETIVVYVQDTNESTVVGSVAFNPISRADTGLNKDSYTLVYQIPTDAQSATITIVTTDDILFQDTVTVRFALDSQPPTTPTLTGPADNHETTATTITFSWTNGADAGAGILDHRLQIDTAGTFVNLVVDSTAATHTLAANDTYFWRVVARDRVANTTTVTARRLTIDTTPPTLPVLTSPATSLETNLITQTFAWTNGIDTGSGINQHRIQIDTANTFASLIVDSTGVTHALPANDTYFWRVLAVDDAGNTRVTASRFFVLDTRPPTLPVLIAPANNHETRATTITFAWTNGIDTGAGINQHRIQIDTANTFASLLVDSTGATHTLPANDTYFWRVLAVDDATNTTVTGSRRLVIDTIPPTAPTLNSPADNHDTNQTTILFSWTNGTDTGSGIREHRLQIDTAATFIDSTGATHTLPANDTYFWRVVAVDNAGNTTTIASRRLRVDTTSPSIGALTTPLANLDTKSTTFTFTWTNGTDTQTGIAAHRVQIDTSNTFVAPLVDSTGATHTLAQDTYYWRVLAVDNATNTSAYPSRRLRVDTTPPSAPTLIVHAGDTNTTLRWGASNDNLGVATYNVQVDTAGTFASLFESVTLQSGDTDHVSAATSPDTYFWRVITTDSAGNTIVSTPALDTFRIMISDTMPPSAFNLTSPSDTHETRATTFFLRWQDSVDDTSPPVRYRVQVDTSGAFTSNVIDTSGLLDTFLLASVSGNTTYRWRVIATDNAGNTRAVSANRTFIVDTRPPTAPVLTAFNGDSRIAPVTLRWTASVDTGTGMRVYIVQVDSSLTFASPRESATLQHPDTDHVSALTAFDTYFWRVIAVDTVGNTETSTVDSFVIRSGDTTPPSAFTLLEPRQRHETNATQLWFRWTAATDSNAVSYRLIIDTDMAGAFVVDTTVADTEEFVRVSPNDTYLWRVIATDTAGNSRTVGDSTFIVDTAPPTQVVLTKFNGDSALSPITFRWAAATDSITSVRSYTVEVDTAGTFVSLVETVTLAHPDTDHVSALVNVDTYFWRVRAYDTVGNISTSLTDSFRILGAADTVPPSAFTLTSPANTTITNTTVITFRWGTSTDDSSPPVRYNLQIDTSGLFTSLVVDTSWLIDTFATVTVRANDTYFWRVIARDNSLNTTVSSATWRILIDTAVPTAPVLTVHAGAIVTPPVYLRWTAAADTLSGLAQYQVQVARDSVFVLITESVTLAPNDTDHWTGILASDTYYWRVTAIDTAGNSRISSPTWDSFRIIVPDTKGPVFISVAAGPDSISNSAATNVTFTVNVTDSAYVETVVIHLAAIGKSDSTAMIPNTAVPSTDSRWTLTTTFETTVVEGPYDLVISARDPSGNWSTTTVRVTVNDFTVSMTEISDTPFANLSAGGTMLSIVSTYGDSYSKVMYEYRTVNPMSGWMTATPSSIAPQPNPNPDTEAPFWGFFWDISTLVSGSEYDVRAVGTNKNGVIDPSPSFVRVKINHADSQIHEYRDTEMKHTRRQSVRADTEALVLIADGTTLFVPVAGVETHVWIRIRIHETAPVTASIRGGVLDIGAGTREFNRMDGLRVFPKTVTITLPYPDTDLMDDKVGSQNVMEKDLAIYRFDDVIGVWVKEPTSKVDPTRNVVTAEVNHFTQFAVLAPKPAAANLANVIIYPNPFIPYDGNDRTGKPFNGADPASGIIFDSLPQQVTIEVYNTAGRRVATMSKTTGGGRFNWDAHGDNNQELASGMYIAILRTPGGEQVIRKIMIIR